MKTKENPVERKVKYLSPTQISLFLEDKLKYYFRYVRGIKEPKTSSVVFGIGIHNALAFYLRQKLLGQKESLDSLHDVFNTARAQEQLRAEQSEGYTELSNDTPEKQSDDAKRILEAALPIVEKLNAKMVEESATIKIGEVPVFMVADVVTSNWQIIDWKTASAKYTLPAAPSLQEIAYSFIPLQHKPELQTIKTKIVTFVRTKQVQVLEREHEIIAQDRELFVELTRQVWENIQAKNWIVMQRFEETGSDDLFSE